MSSRSPRPRTSTPLAPELDAVLASAVAAVSASQPYASPSAAEVRDAVTGLARLAIGDIAGAGALLAPLGFTVATGQDSATGRSYALALAETGTNRAWGLFAVDLGAPLQLCVAVPHPRSDFRCEQLALRLWRKVPGAMLAMATVHRDAAGGSADHSQNTDSVFHRLWISSLGPRGIPQVQIHGFADDTAPEQVVVASGIGPVTPAASRIADEIASTGLVTTRSWDGTADPDLRATTNAQGVAAAAADLVWVHIEHNRTVRDDPALWEPAVDAVAAAHPALLAYDRPSPGGTGHTPKSVGSANTTGQARYFAREDHVHRGAAASHVHAASVRDFAPLALAGESALVADASQGDYFRATLNGDRTLAPPANATDGQRVFVEALASGGRRKIRLDPSIVRASGVPATVTIASGKRWIGGLVYIDGLGWFVMTSVLQS